MKKLETKCTIYDLKYSSGIMDYKSQLYKFKVHTVLQIFFLSIKRLVKSKINAEVWDNI